MAHQVSMNTLPKASVIIGELIAKGGFSQVFEAVFTDQEGHIHRVAAKKVDRSYPIKQREVDIMKELNHSNIIQFIGIFSSNQDTYIIMELAEGGDLRRYLNNFREKNAQLKQPPRLQLDLVWKWVIEAAHGIRYLHSMHHSHRDIKSLNYLIMQNHTLKLGDLGLAKTCQWMAPEVIREQYRSPKSDVFSYGIVVWEIVTTKVPYAEEPDLRSAYTIMEAVCNRRRLQIPDDCLNVFVQLMQCCWNHDYSSRPDMEGICLFLESYMPHVPKVSSNVQEQGHFPVDVHMDTLSPATSADSQTPMSIGSHTSKDQNPGKEGKNEVDTLTSVSSSGSSQPATPEPLDVTVETVLNDHKMMNLADKLGDKWEQLAIRLDFTKADIFRFKQDNNSSVLMAIHAMLVEWRQRQYKQDDVKAVGKELSHALASCGRLDLSGMVDNMCSTKQNHCQ